METKNTLESSVFSMRNSINDEKLRDKIEADDRTAIENKCTEILQWLDGNQNA